MKKNKFQLFFLLSLSLLACLSACKHDAKNGNHASITGRGEGEQVAHLDRYEQEIQKFEEADKAKMPAKSGILFVGSSSIRMWQSAEKDFAPMPVLNRGFGGSTLPEVTYYAERIIVKYQPRLIVFYCGENDIVEGAAPAVAFQNFKKLCGILEQKMPATPMLFISQKPSNDRWKIWKEIDQYNDMVRQFALSRPNLLRFADVRELMKTSSGTPDSSLFLPDQLHLNEKGYQKWVALLKPVISEMYEGKKVSQ